MSEAAMSQTCFFLVKEKACTSWQLWHGPRAVLDGEESVMVWFLASLPNSEWLVGLACTLGSIWRPRSSKGPEEVIDGALTEGLANYKGSLQSVGGRPGRSNRVMPSSPGHLSLLDIIHSSQRTPFLLYPKTLHLRGNGEARGSFLLPYPPTAHHSGPCTILFLVISMLISEAFLEAKVICMYGGFGVINPTAVYLRR